MKENMDNQELIVPFNKEQMEAGLKIMPFMIGGICCLLYLSFWLRRFLGHYITFFIQSIIILLLIMLVIGNICSLFMNKSEPLARLDQMEYGLSILVSLHGLKLMSLIIKNFRERL